MKKKNRFSTLLKYLMSVADLKNYTLAQALQYDTSYISKWTSGRMLPSEKNSDKLLSEISNCIVDALDNDAKAHLFSDYQVNLDSDLRQAIFDNLYIEYNYVLGLKTTTGSEIAPETSFFAELPLGKFAPKLHHPALRKVSSLNVIAVMDIMSLENEYRFMLSQTDSNTTVLTKEFPSVRFTMMINLNTDNEHYTYDAVFLIYMLTTFTHISFQLYGGAPAYGKILLAAKDAYCISASLFDTKYCTAVTISEDINITNALHSSLQSLCTQDLLLFKSTTMSEMINAFYYTQYLLSTGKCWLMGHMTEYFLPDELHDKLVRQLGTAARLDTTELQLSQTHLLVKTILSESPLQIMIYESAITEFVVSGAIDFYNQKVVLSTPQRLQCIEMLLDLQKKNAHLEIKLVHGKFIQDFPYFISPNLFLSDEFCYLRLDNQNYHNNLTILNGNDIKNLFRNFFHEIWTTREDVVIGAEKAVTNIINHALFSLQILSRSEQPSMTGTVQTESKS